MHSCASAREMHEYLHGQSATYNHAQVVGRELHIDPVLPLGSMELFDGYGTDAAQALLRIAIVSAPYTTACIPTNCQFYVIGLELCCSAALEEKTLSKIPKYDRSRRTCISACHAPACINVKRLLLVWLRSHCAAPGKRKNLHLAGSLHAPNDASFGQ